MAMSILRMTRCQYSELSPISRQAREKVSVPAASITVLDRYIVINCKSNPHLYYIYWNHKTYAHKKNTLSIVGLYFQLPGEPLVQEVGQNGEEHRGEDEHQDEGRTR